MINHNANGITIIQQSEIEENRKTRGRRGIASLAIAYVLGLLGIVLICCTAFAPFSSTDESTTPAKNNVEESIAPDTVIEIPDPVLKKVIQDTLGTGDKEITGADALSLISLEYNGKDDEQIKDITGLSAFTTLGHCFCMIIKSAISALCRG